MNEKSVEQQIRDHFKTFTPVEIADSTYLFGINFDTDSIESILDSVIALYREVKELRDLIASDFRKDSEERVLVPRERETQNIVIENCYRKECALNKALSNRYVFESVKRRLAEKSREEKQENVK